MVPNSDRELAENSILCSPGINICQKVSINTHSHPEGLNGFNNQLEDTSTVGETMECDGQESTSVAMEVTEQLEPELLLEVQNNSCEEGICSTDAPTSTPDPQIGCTGDRHEQPYGSSGAD
uniref:Uncharacterized protein n=1 Tax=Arundo donax TaxID=35708 RepID=A0A0A9DKP7_ARUDO